MFKRKLSNLNFNRDVLQSGVEAHHFRSCYDNQINNYNLN